MQGLIFKLMTFFIELNWSLKVESYFEYLHYIVNTWHNSEQRASKSSGDQGLMLGKTGPGYTTLNFRISQAHCKLYNAKNEEQIIDEARDTWEVVRWNKGLSHTFKMYSAYYYLLQDNISTVSLNNFYFIRSYLFTWNWIDSFYWKTKRHTLNYFPTFLTIHVPKHVKIQNSQHFILHFILYLSGLLNSLYAT